MKRKLLKTGSSAIALLLVVAIGAEIISSSVVEVNAAGTFPGIQSVVYNNGETNQFSIVEVVPDAESGEFGYYVGGQEPLNWQEKLAGLQDIYEADGTTLKTTAAQMRADYLKTLYDNTDPENPAGILKDLISSEGTMEEAAGKAPLYYADYQEQASLESMDETVRSLWEELILTDENGYSLEETGREETRTGYYEAVDPTHPDANYNKEFVLDENGKINVVPVEAGTGAYKENVTSYLYSDAKDGYYNLTFKHSSTITGTAYSVKTAGAVTPDALKIADPAASGFIADDTPLYVFDGNYYVYKMTAGQYRASRNISTVEELPEDTIIVEEPQETPQETPIQENPVTTPSNGTVTETKPGETNTAGEAVTANPTEKAPEEEQTTTEPSAKTEQTKPASDSPTSETVTPEASLKIRNYPSVSTQIEPEPEPEYSIVIFQASTAGQYVADEDNAQFMKDKNGWYGSYWNNEGSQYLDALDAEGKPTGNFNITNEITYKYSLSNGDYRWVDAAVEAGGTEQKVTLGYIYVQGGISNQEWLKRYVFDLTDQTMMDSFYASVTSMTPDAVEAGAPAMSMLVFSNPLTQIDGKPLTTSYTAGEAIDFSADYATKLFRQIMSTKLPVIIDSTILTPEVQAHCPNLYNLISWLSSEDPQLLYETSFKGLEENAAVDLTTLTITPKTVNDSHFVSGHIYVYGPGVENGCESGEIVSTAFPTEITDPAKTAGFKEIVTEIDQLNFYIRNDESITAEELENALIPETISQAVIVKYIINYANNTSTLFKTEISVLVLEPCNSYTLNGKNITSEYIKTTWLGNNENITKDDITVTKMTTAKFIGTIEDLNSTYDMIIIGSDISLYNRENTTDGSTTNGAAERTNFNDWRMDGMVYANVGDIVACDASLSGTMSYDFVKDSKYVWGSDFIEQGYNSLTGTSHLTSQQVEVHVAGTSGSGKESVTLKTPGIYRFSGNDITEAKREELVDFAKAGYPIVFSDDFYNDRGSITQRTVNTSRIDANSNMYQLADTLKTRSNVFCVSEAGNALITKYLNIPKLLINMENVKMDSYSAADTYNNGKTCPIYKNVENGKLTYTFSISNTASLSYETSYDCRLFVDINADGKFSRSSEQMDELVITNLTNGEVQTQTDGAYHLSRGYSYKVTRTIPNGYQSVLPWKLEVSRNDNTYIRNSVTGYSVAASDEKEVINILQIKADSTSGSNANNWDMSNSAQLKKYLGNLKNIPGAQNLEVTITATTASQITKNTNLNAYNMLVIGYADCYATLSSDAVKNISNYIKSGKSVLFTHDTTSFVNTSSRSGIVQKDNQGGTGNAWGTNWGYSFNKLIRPLVGMDRYGVMQDALEFMKDGEYTEGEVKAVSPNREIGYIPSTDPSAEKETISEIQGYTYGILNFRKASGQTNLEGIQTGSGQYSGIKVGKVNSGQITTYPYVLPDSIPVADTHYQYYQLDLTEDGDNDGESDIVVWYTIDDNSNNGTNNMYVKSPGDVRNNYYIYSKGNVTYSGVGHSTVKDGDEMKLFVNTLIAAYSAGKKAPAITIHEENDIQSSSMSTAYLTYDQSLVDGSDVTTGYLDSDVTVYFSLSDTNLSSGKQEIVDFYVAGGSDKITAGGEEVNVTKISDNITVSDADGNEVAKDNLKNNTLYHISFPKSRMGTDGTATLYIGAYSNLTDNLGNESETEKAFASLNILRSQLFDLD